MLPLLLLVLAAPKSAPAQAKPVLPSRAAVFVSSPDDAAAARTEAELWKALKDVDVPLVDVPAAFPLPARDESGDTLVKEARQAYDDLDYVGAAAKWNEALQFFVAHPELADAKTLADAHFFAGTLAIQNGGKAQAKKAQEELARALLNNPDLTCDPKLYGADVKKVFDKAAAEVAARGVGRVALDSSPPGATVSLRGRIVGTTPVAEAPSVPFGRHLLLFSKPGFEPAGAYADVSKDGASARPTLKAAPGYVEVRDGATVVIGKGVGAKGPLPPGGKKLGGIVKARFLVLSDGVIAEVWDVETGNRLSALPVSADGLGETARKIGAFIARPGPAGGVPLEVAEEPGAGGPVYKQWWFWTAVGVVAVGGATAAGVAAANNPGGRPFNVVLGIP